MADETSKLGFDASEALAALKRLQRDFEKYSQQLRDAAKASGTFNQQQEQVDETLKRVSTFAELAAGSMKSLTKEQLAAAKAARQLATEQEKIRIGARSSVGRQRTDLHIGAKSSVGRSRPTPKPDTSTLTFFDEAAAFRKTNAAQNLRQIETDLRNVARGAKQAAKDTREFNLSLSSIGKIALTQAALSGLFRLTAAFKDAISAAIDFEIKLAEIATISSTFLSAGLDETGQVVADLSKRFGSPIEEVAAGLYEALSNQIGTAAETTRFMADAMTFGQASVTSTANAVDVLSAVLNSYGLNAANAGDISGKLFRTIDLGRVTGNELSESFGRVLPLAAELGVTFDEVAASIAHLTIQGVKANEAYTLISNVLLKLIRPTKALQGEFDRLGISSVQLGVQAFGLQGFLEQLTEQAGTSAEGVGELFNQIRGTRGVLGLTGKTAEQYAKTLEQIKQAGVEAAEGAAAIIRETPAQSLQREFAAARAFLVNDFGRDAIRVLSGFIKLIGGGENAVRGLGVALAGLALGAGIAGIVAISNSVLGLIATLRTLELSAKAASFAMTRLFPLGIIVAGGAVLAQVLNGITGRTNESIAKLDELREKISETTQIDTVKQRASIKEVAEIFEDTVPQVARSLFDLQNLYNKDRDAAINVQTQLNNSLKNQLSKRVSLLNSFIGNLQSIQSRAATETKNIATENLGLKFQVGQARFQREIQGLESPEQARALVTRSLQILDAARSAANKGNDEFAKTLFAEAASTAEQAANLRQGQVNAEGAVNAVLQERLRFNDELIQQQRDASAEAAKLEQHNQAIADAVSQRVGELQELSLLRERGDVSTVDVKRVAQRQLQLAGEIDSLLARVQGGRLSEVLDTATFKTQLREITSAAFDPTTGSTASFQQAFDRAGTKIISTLQKSAQSTPIEFRIRFKTLTGEEFDPIEGPGKIAQAFSKALSEAQTQNQNRLNLPQLAGDLKIANEEITASLDDLASNQVQRINFLSPSLQADDLRTARTELQSLVSLGLRAQQAVTTSNEAQLAVVLKEIAVAKSSLEERQGFNLLNLIGVDTAEQAFIRNQIAAFDQLQTSVQRAAEALPKLQVAQEQQNAVLLFTDQLKQLPGVTTQAVQSVQNSVNGFSTLSAQQQIDALISKINSIPAVTIPVGAQQRATGGPVGPDTSSVNLTPGEFVVNPRDSRRFRSQLIAMNRGINPGFANGGEVTNNNFGGISVTLSPDQARRLDGGVLDKAIRRAARKKTIRQG